MDVFVVLLISGFCVSTASFPYIYQFVNENKTWSEASTYCNTEDIALAQITQPDNITALNNTPTGEYKGKAWIGLYTAPRWTWLDGTLDTYFARSDTPLYSNYCACLMDGAKREYKPCTATYASLCFNGTKYFVDDKLRTWNDSKTNCENRNSTLAQIKNAETLLQVQDQLPQNQNHVWIGLHMTPAWLWSETNQIPTVTNWGTGQPENQNGDELCAAVVVEDGTWTAEPCNAQYPFFCYEIYKLKKTLVSMNIQTDANLEKPENSAALMQQLKAALINQGVTDFKLTWKKQPVKKKKKTTEDPCSP